MRTSELPDASWRWGGDRAQGVAALLLIFWLPLCGWLFWHFDGRYLSGAADQLVRFDPQALPAAPYSGVVTVLYLADDRCPCSRGLSVQVTAVQQRFGDSVRQLVAADSELQWRGGIERLDADAAASWRAAVPQWPAVAVWRADGVLAYIGPLSGGGCGVSGDGIAAIVGRAFDGFALPAVAVDVAGCFCADPARMARTDPPFLSGTSTFTGHSS